MGCVLTAAPVWAAPVKGCNQTVLTAMEAKAQARVAYDVASTEQVLDKPDSVLFMTCFNNSAGNAAANIGTQLASLKFSRDDETEADLVGLELAARAGFKPEASVSLWEKMAKARGAKGESIGFLSTHPTGPDRIKQLKDNLPRVRGLYEQARR